MRALKIAGIVVGSLVGLIVLGAVAILLLVNPNDYRDDIAKLAQQHTGRPLQIRGDLGLKLFPWIALEINDVTLGNPPGYGNEPFLTVARAQVGVKLLPLLHKEVQVRKVSVDGLSVTLISRSADENNWKDLGESSSTEPEVESGAGAKATIAGVAVTKATLIYRDEAKKSVTRLSGLEVHTGPVGGSEPVDAELKFDYGDGENARVAHIETKARFVMPPDSSRIEIRNLDATADWFGSPKAGENADQKAAKPLALSLSAPSLVLDTKAETLAPATIAVKVGDLSATLSAQGEKLFGAYIIHGKIDVPKTSPRELMKSVDFEAPVTRDPKALSSFSLRSDYRLTETQLQLTALDLTLDETTVKGRFGIEDLEAMAMRFDLDVNAIDLDQYMAPKPAEEKGAGSAGSVPAAASKAAPPTDLPIEMLRGLDVKGQLRVGRAKVADLPFTEVRLPLEAKDGLTHLGPTQAKMFGGTYGGDIVLDARPARATLSMNEHVRGIDMGALLKAGFETTRVVGRGNANAQLNAVGNTDAALFKSLAGKIGFDVKDGAVTGIDLWFELRRALALFKRQAQPTRPAGEPKTAFNAMSGNATIDQGVLRNDDLLVDMSYLRVKGKGSLALESQAVDYRLVTEVYKLPEGDDSLGDLKAAEIPVTITGTLADMKVRPDVEGYLKARFKKEVDRKVDEKKEELRKKLGDKLKGLLGQ
jgi:AsmA protein